MNQSKLIGNEPIAPLVPDQAAVQANSSSKVPALDVLAATTDLPMEFKIANRVLQSDNIDVKSALQGFEAAPLTNLFAERPPMMKNFMLKNQISNIIDKAFANEEFSVEKKEIKTVNEEHMD